jgi:hypothetical protein
MTDLEFEILVEQLFDKHASKLGGDHWNRGEDGLDSNDVQRFAKELREILEKKSS